MNFAGVGALSSPLVATQFAQLSHWSFHYLVSMGIALSNAIILIAVFRFKTQDGGQFLRNIQTGGLALTQYLLQLV